ncbi:MAG TPA: Na(+)/H(+) antiporter subunit C [Micromonosporaceae bacterium]|nr:Na(+)/H(+) antiporter subunit C [Micromonosporaceae bacterium]
MDVDLILMIIIAVLFACGVALVLERSLTRVVLGFLMLGNGANLLILSAGRPGGPPIVGVSAAEDMSDPLAQAMVLTAIVITLGVSAFLVAMAYRSWQYAGNDEVRDDIEDRRIMTRAARDLTTEGSDAEASDTDDQIARAALADPAAAGLHIDDGGAVR